MVGWKALQARDFMHKCVTQSIAGPGTAAVYPFDVFSIVCDLTSACYIAFFYSYLSIYQLIIKMNALISHPTTAYSV